MRGNARSVAVQGTPPFDIALSGLCPSAHIAECDLVGILYRLQQSTHSRNPWCLERDGLIAMLEPTTSPRD